MALVPIASFLDPPYKDTESMYSKSNFDANQHIVLFDFMADLNEKFGGKAKFLITYNNTQYIRELAEAKGFMTFVQPRLHGMRQAKEPGAEFYELLIANYDLLKQADENRLFLFQKNSQLTLFDYKSNHEEE